MSNRADDVVSDIRERELDALLVTAPLNVRWLTGFTGSSGLAIIGPDRRAFVTDFRYVTQAERQVGDFDRRRAEAPSLLTELPEVLPGGPLRLGYDDAEMSVRAHGRLRELLDDRIELVAAGGLVEDRRAVKDAFEVERIRAAAALADDAFRAMLEEGIVGRMEAEVALELETAMRQLGADAASFSSIVAHGTHGALPHAEPRAVTIEPDRLVTIDWGCQLDGYCSDCTRTLATGDGLGDEAREVYEVVRSAQAAALDAVRPGPKGHEVDAVAREVIEEAGFGELFGHGLGHGVGLEVHEAPRLSRHQGDQELRAGHVVTVEPGIYVPGEHGVRIEDLVVVTDDGCEVLTSLPKELQVVR